MKRIILAVLIIGLCAGCMHQNKFGEFNEKSGRLELSMRENPEQDFRFGDCFLYQEGDERYMLLVTGVYPGEFTTFTPIAVPAVDSIDEFSVGKFMVNYYSREPGVLDRLLGGEAQYGGFGFSVFPENLPQVSRNLHYLFTVNLSPGKTQEFGSTALFTDYPLGYTIRFCLDFESISPDRPMVAKLPLESLCM
ncbi:hypothetical protein [Pontibacter flavimaris]|uniref:Uncharacterized protein n=1 Tax=Pontibacter flavimaris TaxID=1797110 RepID=A0A1Q5PIC6_9BACT|nr:hypothetical protein [Pontibacter flavimaris]OKL41961.1 hypothetical protein A3841_08115 [Pontibacter flavimaris]